MQILAASDADREWAARLMADSEPWLMLGLGLEACRRVTRDPELLLYVAHREGRPRGVIVLDPRGVAGSPYIKSIAVESGYRSGGIGAALVEFSEDLFHGEARHMFLCVSSFNERARAFWEGIGYRAVGELPDFIVDGHSEILMHKRLG